MIIKWLHCKALHFRIPYYLIITKTRLNRIYNNQNNFNVEYIKTYKSFIYFWLKFICTLCELWGTVVRYGSILSSCFVSKEKYSLNFTNFRVLLSLFYWFWGWPTAALVLPRPSRHAAHSVLNLKPTWIFGFWHGLFYLLLVCPACKF